MIRSVGSNCWLIVVTLTSAGYVPKYFKVTSKQFLELDFKLLYFVKIIPRHP